MDTCTEIIAMSRKETPRPGILRALLAGQITNRQAADALHLTIRQVQRLRRRFDEGGVGGLLHRGRGRPSGRRLADGLQTQIVTLMQEIYTGFNDVHLTEKLREVHGLDVCRETVRRLRRRHGLAAVRPRRAPRYRRRRTPAAAAGSLIQVDGSPFAWLEARGPQATLLGAIDDATGAVVGLLFRPAEDLHGYASRFQHVFVTHGLPLAAYRDRLGCRYARVVGRDNTVRVGVRWLAIPPGAHGRSFAGCHVELRELLDGRLQVRHDGHLLAEQPAPPGFELRPRPSARVTAAAGRPAAASRVRVAPPRPRLSPEARQQACTGPQHPWSRSITLHVLRKAQRTRS